MKFIPVACLLLALTARAAPNWPEEPTSLFGLEFGKTLEEQGVLPCAAKNDNMCLSTFGGPAMLAKVPGLQEMKPMLMVSAHLTGNIFEGASIYVGRQHGDRLRDMATAKYGPPHGEQVEESTNGLGARFQGKVLYWMSEHTVVRFREFAADTRLSSLQVVRRAHLSAKDGQRQQQAQKDKAAL